MERGSDGESEGENDEEPKVTFIVKQGTPG